MSRIVVGGDWAYLDMLDGCEIKQGENLRVTWPDGTVNIVGCEVEEKRRDTMDMGHAISIVTRRVFITIFHHGRAVRVYLVGLEAERVGGVK